MKIFPTLLLYLMVLGFSGLGSAQSGLLTIADPKVGSKELSYSDCVSFKAKSSVESIEFEIHMQKTIEEGMFTCLHVYLDCDGNPETGIGGAELWLRASVGSRFHPNKFEAKGEMPAMSIRRASLSILEDRESPDGKPNLNWVHRHLLDAPEVDGKTLRCKVETSFLAEFGSRYSSIVGVRARVDTSCSDQPLMLRHACSDKGIPIVLDGRDEDWCAGQVRKDDAGELHEVGQQLDLTRLRVEHDAKFLFACVSLAKAGLSKNHLPSDDVIREDRVTLYIEPIHPRYQEPFKALIHYGSASQAGISSDGKQRWQAELAGKVIEFRVPMNVGQSSFRVWAWSDLLRNDRLGDYSYQKLDWSKKG